MLLLHYVRKHVPTNTKIYLHCFSGDEYVLQQWRGVFPNLYLGFTRLVNSFDEHQMKALRSVDNKHLLLETDAPYFPISGQRWSSPGQLYSVAEIVAGIRKVSAKSILQFAASNARDLFG